MNLPQDFIQRMNTMLGSEATDFFASYEQPKAYGLRINPLKYGGSFSCDFLPFTLSPVPWCKEGYYANPEEHPGRHPLHEGGSYYIQEPSAMSVVSLLQPEPGEAILDFCAAPGGKSTGIAGRMDGRGLLVSNEIIPSRAKILSQNIERMGVSNAVVTNEPPEKLSRKFPAFFDKILVDAPCSGEGMFRKDETAIAEWTPDQVKLCAERQKLILNEADAMLKDGGVLVYSTCTFSPEEDEEMILWFLKTHPGYQLEDWHSFLPETCGLADGKLFFALDSPLAEEATKTLRLWPHKLRGEGHFAARLRKPSCTTSVEKTFSKKKGSQKKGAKKADITDYLDFCETYLKPELICPEILSGINAENLRYFGDELYHLPSGIKSLEGIKVLRAGLHLGTRKKNRFEPAHALARVLHSKQVTQCHICNDDQIIAYLKGEPLSCDSAFRGWTLVCYQNLSFGWGKASGGVLKNHYPKGLRIY